jgi:tRNA (guanine-N7-)-methyltransferase
MRQHTNPLAFLEPIKADLGNGPFIVDVGCGKGDLLLELARSFLEKKFVGIEIRHLMAKLTKERFAEIPNVTILQGNASISMAALFKPGSVEQIFIGFPDPWMKNRYKKRTLFTPQFLEESYEVLMPKGKLFVQTDNEELFNEIKGRFIASKFKESASTWPDFKTYWEKLKKDNKIYKIVYQKG